MHPVFKFIAPLDHKCAHHPKFDFGQVHELPESFFAFVIDEEMEANSINKLLKSKILLIDKGGYYTLNDNFDNLLDIGKQFENFINKIEALFKAYL